MSWDIDLLEAPLKKVVIVGRPNVGKSTLFNQLTRTKDAIVDDRPGVTVDLHYGLVSDDEQGFVLVDSGGYEPTSKTDVLGNERNKRVISILKEASVILFVVDVRAGLQSLDEILWKEILEHRQVGAEILILANKADVARKEFSGIYEFYALHDKVIAVSAEHKVGVVEMKEQLLTQIGLPLSLIEAATEEKFAGPINFAFIGRPNVGKSTWCNRILKEERSVVSPTAGTTRDVLQYPLQRHGADYVVFDTAGMRRPGRREDGAEAASSMKALRLIEQIDVAVLVVDAIEGLTDLDVRIASEAWHRGAGLVILANKWDEARTQRSFKEWVHWFSPKLSFMDGIATVIASSGKTGKGEKELFESIARVAQARRKRIETSALNRGLRQWAIEKPHPRTGLGHLVTFHYAIQTGRAPQRYLLFSNRPREVERSYLRYIENKVRKEFSLGSNPIYFAVKPESQSRR